MCLILTSWQSHPEYPLVVLANRDEFYERATDPMGWWDDHPNILAGRDRADVKVNLGLGWASANLVVLQQLPMSERRARKILMRKLVEKSQLSF